MTVLPYVVAELRPPPGLAFVGFFYYTDDFYNYLSFAQQAEDGAFVFRNKAVLDEHRPALVNLEWWIVGRLGRALGHRLILAYRVFGALVAGGFLLVSERWLRRLGVPESHRLPALVLIATGGGLGGLLFTFTARTMPECLDLNAGLFPFLELLVNPHFVAGTTLLLLAWLRYDDDSGPWGLLTATLAGTALALVRPYDFVLLVAVRFLVVAVGEPPSKWFGKVLPLAGLLPAVAYLYWLFYANPAFAFYSSTSYGFPSGAAFAWALGPALVLALPGVARTLPGPEARRARQHLVAWAVVGLVVIAVRPLPYSLQFLVGIGFPLLTLGALGLARLRPGATLLVAAVFATTLVVALRYLLSPAPLWFMPLPNVELVHALRERCRAQDIVFAPPEIGLLAYGLTPCQAFVSHPIAPDYQQRLEELARFARAPAPERLALLRASGITVLVLPGDAGPTPAIWLGPDSGFVREAVVAGGHFSLYRFGPAGDRAQP
jgi:hypothetical protein